MAYPIDRGRNPATTFDEVTTLLDEAPATRVVIPVDRAIVEAMARIPRAEVPDLPDRLIAATGLALGVPVVSRDRQTRSSAVATVW